MKRFYVTNDKNEIVSVKEDAEEAIVIAKGHAVDKKVTHYVAQVTHVIEPKVQESNTLKFAAKCGKHKVVIG